MYDTESALVTDFVQNLADSGWEDVIIGLEFDYQRGRADIVAIDNDGQLIAFEAKLSKWREALHQAYRNLCFANRSYVVLPRQAALKASLFPHEFERRGVGLCYVDNLRVIVLYEARSMDPIQPRISDRAAVHVISSDA